jgi:hypothetical protein
MTLQPTIPAQALQRLLQQLQAEVDRLHQPPATSPSGAVVLPPHGRQTIDPWVTRASLLLRDRQGRETFSARRHFSDICAPYWRGDETRYDDSGRAWKRDLHLVIDDFGDLVEVKF